MAMVLGYEREMFGNGFGMVMESILRVQLQIQIHHRTGAPVVVVGTTTRGTFGCRTAAVRPLRATTWVFVFPRTQSIP